ncbi:hypothetical protein M041_gp16 [Mycobacterium phage Severus]|uniref:hypothetical protein n=1 Tax=Mycobacterium phage Severus TaxID=1327776 RepID=UPI00032B56D4|nr:hypothetical protein M041_gp16 [Mycobacterium phage Severus]AVO22469.1 hypothetical protein SEA_KITTENMITTENS_69 [Mycobacterium phage KittenMittens]QWS69354.1 hypothetical protein SEA_PEACEMEAL1_70 [Mycobacterium Phage PeaceMeal1]QZD97054.1 hypothetical protein SEA_DRAKE94_70 [Mycobacterium phage Drake94]USL89200.1 hypothetical protein SEA_POOMPHA_70 [Mycobacterium phage Poompha]AGK88003.1 hypothetical protein PBI_SEVERUS_71 [Mycobacterium phage Severus]
MATKLLEQNPNTSVIARKEAWINTLEVHLEKARQQLAELTSELPEPAEEGTVIRFRKYNQIYTFAAIKVGGSWFITQDGSRTSRQGHAPKSWSQLLAWIGERNWNTIEVLS